MKEMLKPPPVLTDLLGFPANMVRAHIKYKVGDIGRYCFLVDKKTTGKNVNQYYVMRADLPKILHRELTPEEIDRIEGRRRCG